MNLPTTEIWPKNHFQAKNCIMTKFCLQNIILPTKYNFAYKLSKPENCLKTWFCIQNIILPTNHEQT